MTFTRINLTVSHSQYWLAELGGLDGVTDDMYRGFNGLISAHEFLAIIMTGTDFGKVSVSADWRETAPPLDLDSWDEVVEVSMLFDDELGCLSGSYDSDPRFPLLPLGRYRIRVHARGRDRAALRTDDVRIDPVEEHLIVAWPDSEQPEVVYKSSDNYGAQVRAR